MQLESVWVAIQLLWLLVNNTEKERLGWEMKDGGVRGEVRRVEDPGMWNQEEFDQVQVGEHPDTVFGCQPWTLLGIRAQSDQSVHHSPSHHYRNRKRDGKTGSE